MFEGWNLFMLRSCNLTNLLKIIFMIEDINLTIINTYFELETFLV